MDIACEKYSVTDIIAAIKFSFSIKRLQEPKLLNIHHIFSSNI